jgi:hypothetical protein
MSGRDSSLISWRQRIWREDGGGGVGEEREVMMRGRRVLKGRAVGSAMML